MNRFFPIVFLPLCCCCIALAQDEPTTQPDSNDPREIRRGIEMGGSPEERARQFYERVIAKVEPSLVGDVNNMPQYLDLFVRELVEDPRTFAVSLHYGITGDAQAAVDGYVEFAEHQSALKEYFKFLKLPGVVDQTELLPSNDLGEWLFGAITSPNAFIYDKPEGRRETLTECAQGDTIYLLKKVGDSFLCHSPSGYVGFIDAKNVRAIDQKALARIESQIGVQRGAQIESMIAAARKYMGVKYVWGGNSESGIDCSGLVFNAFKTIGITMPRDADQQFIVGRLVGTRWHRSEMRRGDTLYFLGRRGTIHHTAIYLGDGKFLEASSPGVKVSSFNPGDENYSEKRDKSFCFAKRVIE